MARPKVQDRLAIAKDDIEKLFEGLETRCFDLKAITKILDENRTFWRLGNISRFTFIDFLIEKSKLQKKIFEFPTRPATRYTWEDIPLYELILSLKPKSFFSHYSAMYFHNLTNQVPKTIYLNHEQTPKPKSASKLTQEKIDFAFRCKTRLSNTIATYKENSIRILNSKHTGNLGVIEAEVSAGLNVYLTDIERTLIDITVRPEYSGGPQEVLAAFKNAVENVSINKLVSILKKIDYVYPYHQAIGFYLEASGVYREKQINLLRKHEMRFDFYLMHQVQNAKYSSKWKLFYPKGLG